MGPQRAPLPLSALLEAGVPGGGAGPWAIIIIIGLGVGGLDTAGISEGRLHAAAGGGAEEDQEEDERAKKEEA